MLRKLPLQSGSIPKGQSNSALQDFPNHFQYLQLQLCWMIVSWTSPQSQSSSDCFSLLPLPLVALLLLAGQSWPFSECEFHEERHVSVVQIPLQVHLGLSNLH